MKNPTLQKIYKASLNFLVPLTPEKTYATIVKEAIKLVDAEMGTIMLEEKGELIRVYSTVPLELQVKHRKRGFLYRAFKSGKPTILSTQQIERAHPEIKKLSIESDVIVPLSYRNKSIGILAILSKEEEKFTNEEVNTLVLFGAMASLAIQKALLYAEIQKSLEVRDFFISAAAHEIKTPVTTIFGYAQLLYENNRKGREIKNEWVSSLNSECYRLKYLINDFLEASRINIGKMHYDLKECSLNQIFNRVIDNFKFNYPERKLVYKNSLENESDIIIGDADRLIQAISNLIDNAVKFSPSDSKIFLNLRTVKSDFSITVTDKGKGINKKDLPKIFERYFKGTGNQHEGLGLGLFLVKNIIEHHHGSIHLHSAVNRGTTIELRLPELKIPRIKS